MNLIRTNLGVEKHLTPAEFVGAINEILMEKTAVSLEEFASLRGGTYRCTYGKVQKNKRGVFQTVWVESGRYCKLHKLKPGLTLDDRPDALRNPGFRSTFGYFTDWLRRCPDGDMSLTEAVRL